MSLTVTPQPTPNPNAMKFVTNATLSNGTQTFYNAEAAAENPTAKALFDLPGVTGVMLLGEFCSVNKTPEATWDELAPAVAEVLSAHHG